MTTLDRLNIRLDPAHAAQKESLAQDLINPVKPDVDLQNWAALGSAVKPSRADRRTKRTWKRGAR